MSCLPGQQYHPTHIVRRKEEVCVLRFVVRIKDAEDSRDHVVHTHQCPAPPAIYLIALVNLLGRHRRQVPQQEVLVLKDLENK